MADAFEGEITVQSRPQAKAVDALFEAGALKPSYEEAYRMNPRLREFIADHFASYHAYQALRGVTGTMRQARTQWRELRRLKASGSRRNVDSLLAALDESIADIAYSIHHNLTMLYALLGNQFGNVEGLSEKLRQNAYYLAQVKTFLLDMETIRAFVGTVRDEAIVAGLPNVSNLISRRLGAQLLEWTGQLKDAQAAITRRLFEARRMEARLKQLSNFAIFLDRHKTTSGWEVEIADPEAVPLALWRPDRQKIRAQPDVLDPETCVQDALKVVVDALPARLPDPLPKPPAEPHRLVVDDGDEVLVEVEEAHELALRAVMERASAPGAAPVSLMAFKGEHPPIADLDDGAWLMFCFVQLQGSGFSVAMLESPHGGSFVGNEAFYDILLSKESK